MSIAMEETDQIETASGRFDIAASTTTENALSFEATEDRLVWGAQVAVSGTGCTVELSFSSQMLFDSEPVQDDTASGILALGRDTIAEFVKLDGKIVWNAGEELNLHLDNASASTRPVFVIIYYMPIGEFRRRRLRNS